MGLVGKASSIGIGGFMWARWASVWVYLGWVLDDLHAVLHAVLHAALHSGIFILSLLKILLDVVLCIFILAN